jgi:pantetheine-phosphate adenylyltransferase
MPTLNGLKSVLAARAACPAAQASLPVVAGSQLWHQNPWISGHADHIMRPRDGASGHAPAERLPFSYRRSRPQCPKTVAGLGFPMKTKAVYPGTFDPVTNGHIDLIQRGAALFDHLYVALLSNAEKTPLFSVEERVEMLEEAVKRYRNVSVTTFEGLLVDYAEKIGASVIVRGIRAVSDYEYELQMAMMNRRLSSRVETVFLMPAEAYSYLSSRLVKEISQLGGSVRGLVPPGVERRLKSGNAKKQ